MKKLLMLVLTAIMVVSCSFLNVSAAPIGSTQTYKVTLKIAGSSNSGTISKDFGFTFYGTKGKVTHSNLSKKVSGTNPFTKGKTRSYTFNHADLGIIYAVEVTCGSDAVKLDYVRIESQYDGDENMYNQISVGSWVEKGRKMFFADEGSIFKISILNGDGLFDGTSDKVSVRMTAPNGDTTRNIPVNLYTKDNVLHRGQTDSFIVFSNEKLSSVSNVYVKRNSSLTENTDDWQPVAVTVQKLNSSQSTASEIRFSTEKIYLCNEPIPNGKEIQLTYHSEGNLNIASIFYEPNFWVILSITVLLIGLGVLFVVVKKKESKKDLKQANAKRKGAVKA